jgi:hypothetical protein
VLEGTIDEKDRTDVVAIHFKETPAHSSFDWRNDPDPQYVITLSGTLEFTTHGGETFIVRARRCPAPEDHIGTGHKWRLIDGRAYVVLKPGAKDSFVAKTGSKAAAAAITHHQIRRMTPSEYASRPTTRPLRHEDLVRHPGTLAVLAAPLSSADDSDLRGMPKAQSRMS